MCVSAMVVCWGLALLWQADVTQSQCDSFLWVIVLPTSFLIHLNNIKAYRLSVIIRANFKRLKPFSHTRVLIIALCWTAVTAVVLLLIHLIDGPKRVISITDSLRPSHNRYQCAVGPISQPLLITLSIGHVIASVVCVVSVRNGMEAFRDGTIKKEAFIILYFFVFIAMILQLLDLPLEVSYLLRVSFTSCGVTLFCVRILISRTMRHVIPRSCKLLLTYMQSTLITRSVSVVSNNYARENSFSGRYLTSNVNADGLAIRELADRPVTKQNSREKSNGKSLEHKHTHESKDSSDQCMLDVMSVLSDPARAQLLFSVAKDAECQELLEFLCKIIRHREEVHTQKTRVHKLHESAIESMEMNVILSDKALKLGRELLTSSDSNISSKVSQKVKSEFKLYLDEWIENNSTFPSAEWTRDAIKNDYYKRIGLFEPVCKDICVYVHERLWDEFSAQEIKNTRQSNEVRKFDA